MCGKCGAEMNDDDLCCARCGWKQQSAPAPKAAEKSGTRGVRALTVTLIVILAALTAVGGCLFFIYRYRRSEEYMVKKAEAAILDGNYEEGLDAVSGFKSARADAIRAFTEILINRERYASAFEPQALQSDSDSVRWQYDALLTAFKDFSDADKLPTELRKCCYLYKERLDGMDAVFGAVTEEDLIDAQRCVLDFKRRKEGASFTIEELALVTLLSELAVQKLDGSMLSTQAYQDFFSCSNAQAVSVMNAFYNTAFTQVSQNRFDLQKYKSDRLENKQIKLNDITDSYEAKVADGLRPLADETDLALNAVTLRGALKYAWLAYAFDIQT